MGESDDGEREAARIRYQTLAERAEAANELASMLSVQLRDVMRERDALRAWADLAPLLYEQAPPRSELAAWLRRCPEHGREDDNGEPD